MTEVAGLSAGVHSCRPGGDRRASRILSVLLDYFPSVLPSVLDYHNCFFFSFIVQLQSVTCTDEANSLFLMQALTCSP